MQSSKKKIQFFSLLFNEHFYGLFQRVLLLKGTPCISLVVKHHFQLLVAVFQIPEIIFKLWSRSLADTPRMKTVFLDLGLVWWSYSLNRGSEVHTHTCSSCTPYTQCHISICVCKQTHKNTQKTLQAHTPCLCLSLLKETLLLHSKSIIIFHRDGGMESPIIRG